MDRAQKEITRFLNDQLRLDLTGGGAFMTVGVAALGHQMAERIFDVIATFDQFNETSDPHGEHDFGSFRVDHNIIFFKIDYFSKDMEAASPDPSDPAVTKRILTIMLAEEY